MIFVTQVIDPDDPALGIAVSWADALSQRCARLLVIANEVRPTRRELDFEVISLGKEHQHGRARRLAAYQRALFANLRSQKWDAILAHMCPDYATAAAPLAKCARVPILLWCTAATSYTVRLKVAEFVTDHIVTSLPGSYPGRHRSVHVIGHGTTLRAAPDAGSLSMSPPWKILALGRTSPSKGFHRIIDGFAAAVAQGLDATLEIVGPSTTTPEGIHRQSLIAQVEAIGMTDRITIAGPVPSSDVPDLIRSAHLLVNATVDGSGDKVVFEALANHRFVLASSSSFATLLSDFQDVAMFDRDDPSSLAARLLEFERRVLPRYRDVVDVLADRVARHHSVDGWADQVLGIAVHGHSSHRTATT